MQVILSLFLVALPGTGAAPSVSAPWGQIEGVDRISEEGVSYFAYLGIPFAKPPVGALRFQKPVSYHGVKVVFNASTYGPRCLQTDGERFQSEDCLQLNVFLPRGTSTSSRKAVLVWIHGGAFMWGGAKSYEPHKLVTKGGVIVVTIQYRLGIFGFLSTGNDLSPGNYGLWDQHLALKWVKKNIASFGGDTKRITIIGESSGASSVAYHTIYPGSKGLFRRAVLQSGAVTRLTPVTPIEDLSGSLGCPLRDRREILMCLRNKNSVLLQKDVTREGLNAPIFRPNPWGPVIDGDFITQDPHVLMQSTNYMNTTPMSDVDVMVGINNNEGGWILYTALQHDRQMNATRSTDIFQPSTYDKLLKTTLDSFVGSREPAITDIVRNLYTYSRQPPGTPLPQKQVFDTFGDPRNVMPALHFAGRHADVARRSTTYLYLFDNYPSFTGDNPIQGTNHGLDTIYLFDLSPRTVRKFLNTGNISPAEHTLSDTFAEFIAEFGKHGNADSVIERKHGLHWPQFDSTNESFLAVSTNMSIGHHLYPQRASIWLDVIPMLVSSWNTDRCNPDIVPLTSGTGRPSMLNATSLQLSLAFIGGVCSFYIIIIH